PPPAKPDVGFDIVQVPIRRKKPEPDPLLVAPNEAREYVTGIVPPRPTHHKTFEMASIKVDGAAPTGIDPRTVATMPSLRKMVSAVAPGGETGTEAAADGPRVFAPVLDAEVDARSRTVGGRTAKLIMPGEGPGETPNPLAARIEALETRAQGEDAPTQRL